MRITESMKRAGWKREGNSNRWIAPSSNSAVVQEAIMESFPTSQVASREGSSKAQVREAIRKGFMALGLSELEARIAAQEDENSLLGCWSAITGCADGVPIAMVEARSPITEQSFPSTVPPKKGTVTSDQQEELCWKALGLSDAEIKIAMNPKRDNYGK